METRKLGESGPIVPALGLGCMGMSDFYGDGEEAESIATIHRATELGVAFLDTAALAAKKGCTPAQLALAWVLRQGNDIVPIPGTKRRRYLEENIGALDVHLTVEDLDDINATLPPGAAAGTRYSEPGMGSINR